MPFEIKMTENQIIDGLRSNYGKEFTAPDVRGFCAANDIAYQTVTKKIEKFKVGRGKWKKIKGYKDPEPPDVSSSMGEFFNKQREYDAPCDI